MNNNLNEKVEKKMDKKIKEVLAERGSNYGPFSGHAAAAQDIKAVIREALSQNPNYQQMGYDKRAILDEGLDMIAHKIGRIVNGDPCYSDSWVDIAGYATITDKFLNDY